MLVILFLVLSCAHVDNVTPIPAAPADVTLSPSGPDAVNISWTGTSGDYDGILIERRTGDKEYSTVAVLGHGVVSYTDKGLAAGTAYRYRLSSYIGDCYSDRVEVEYMHRLVLPAPGNLLSEKTHGGLRLTWTDNCSGEEGYLVTKKIGEGERVNLSRLPANTTEYVDAETGNGRYEYEVIAYWRTYRSEPATCVYENISLPKVEAGKVDRSWYMASVEVKLTDDGGEKCDVGVCWSESGMPVIENGNVYQYSAPVAALESAYGNAIGLEASRNYILRCWARNSVGVVYSEPVEVSVDAQPEALLPDWEELTSYGLPSEVQLYSTETEVTGRRINAWYAVADMSSGNIELKTVMRPDRALMTVSDFVQDYLGDEEEVYVMVNGGYFDSAPQSFSYVKDRGVHLAKNIASLTRGMSYSITRGAFGVDKEQKPSVKWIYNNGESLPWAYNVPLPVVDGERTMTPTSTFPDDAGDWDVYSAIGGAPVILHEGRLCFDYLMTSSGKYKTNHELLQADIYGESVRPPRTAIGHTADGRIVLMVVDGRGAGGSNGVTLNELACLMKGVGCTDALNLDGGGSSTICVTDDAHLLNMPSDGTERKVCSFVGFVRRK